MFLPSGCVPCGAKINRAWKAVQRDWGDAAAIKTLYGLAHGLAGSGATFGFPRISAAAQGVKRLLLPGMENNALESNLDQTSIEDLVEALECAAADTRTWDDPLDLSTPKPEHRT